MLLSTTNLTVGYGAVEAVRGIDIDVAEGEIVALLGANGAGKSSTLNALVGLTSIQAGEVTFDGMVTNNLSPEQLVRRGLTLTPEGRRVFAALTVEENLILGGYTLGTRSTAFTDNLSHLLDLFPILKDRRQQLAGTLSGGQQQQLAIARAMMSSPKLLLLDEPSLGLAPQIVEKIFELIDDLRAAGTTILLVEQNVALSLDIADRGYLMASGRIVTTGSGAELASSNIIEQAYLGAGEGA
ncbi:MAG: ABC transporter ATP-binding protein [Pseudomonadota bacterium]